jgi:tetratricopeptide (TPR) repeat protein
MARILLLFSALVYYSVSFGQSEAIEFTRAQEINSFGYELMLEGNHDKAKGYFLKAIELDSTQISFFYNLSNIYLKTSRIQLAQQTYDEIKQRFPTESDIYICILEIFFKRIKTTMLQ